MQALGQAAALTFRMADVFRCTRRTSDRMVFQISASDSLFTMSCKRSARYISLSGFLQQEGEASHPLKLMADPGASGLIGDQQADLGGKQADLGDQQADPGASRLIWGASGLTLGGQWADPGG